MLESSRNQWEEASRRVAEEARDPIRHRQLLDLVAVVSAGLRRRVGGSFTLADLDRAYGRAEDWVRDSVEDALPPKARVGLADAALVQDAAFAVYARGAVDYRP